MQSTFVEIETAPGNRHPVHVHKWGQRPPVLCLHGLLHSGRVWDRVASHLENDFTLICPDYPGVGKTPPLPISSISFDTYVSLTDALIDAVTVKWPLEAIVADSLGALLVLEVHLKRRRLAYPLILSGCPIGGLSGALNLLRIKGLAPTVLRINRSLPRSISFVLMRMFSGLTVTRTHGLDRATMEEVLTADPRTVAKLLCSLYVDRMPPRQLQSDDPRITIIRGEFDRIVSLEALNTLAHNLNAPFREIPGVGHACMIEAPPDYAAAIRESICI